MSLAENLLNSLDETAYQNMRIAGGVPEEHIKVGQDRVITVPNSLKTIAVKGDKDIETATIDCVRYWDGHDLSTFAIYLNYILPSGDQGTYIPQSITKSEDTFSFDWLIGSEFTYAQGKMTFWIVAKLTDDVGTLKKQWSSFQNSDCTIAQGGDKIYVPEKQTDQDVISQAISISRASAEIAEQQVNLAQSAARTAASDATEAAREEVERLVGQLGIVQSAGNSRVSVVSQAVTTELYNRNSKRITNLERGIAEQFETDSSVSYVKDVPENALPYAEVKKIGGMTYKDGNTLRSAKVTEVKSVGVNIWDEEWEIGYIDLASGTLCAILSKNFIAVKPSTTYYMYNGSRDGHRIVFYDNSKNLISSTSGNPFSTPPNCYYIKFYSIGTEYKNDICINVSDYARNGKYYPYQEHTLPIPEAVRALDGYGWGVNDEVYNYVDWEKKQFVKRVVKVDLGTLAWQITNTAGLITLNDMSLTPQWIASTMPSKIKQAAYDGTMPVFYVFFDDGAYTSHYQLIEDLQGVMLYYELATPEVTDISDLITADNIIGVEGGGTLTFENEYGYAVPSEVEYQVEV